MQLHLMRMRTARTVRLANKMADNNSEDVTSAKYIVYSIVVSIYTVYGTEFCVQGSDMALGESVPYTVHISTTILYIIHIYYII